MSKYEPLWNYLLTQNEDIFMLSFEKIHSILGFDIDHSFLNFKKESADYGYTVSKISIKEKWVRFDRN